MHRYSIPALKVFIFLLALWPFVDITWDAINNRLGANPLQTLHYRTGDWTLRFLLISLSITPLRKWANWTLLQRFRRMMGLYAFFYASLHFSVWLILEQSLRWDLIIEDTQKSPYVLVGMLAWFILLPLAITSTKGMMRRLGKRWKKLHQLIYPCSVLAILHFVWLVKADFDEPLIYGFILLALLLSRAIPKRRKQTLSRTNKHTLQNQFKDDSRQIS